MKVKKRIKNKIKEKLWLYQNARGPKVFGIGNNKTGTTSLEKAMRTLGFKVGNQRFAEKNLMKPWSKRDFKPIIEYCQSAEFFQDVPFSKPFTFIALDQAYPKSKFILTVRDNPEQWYNSLTKFHAKLWGENGRVPTKEDLQRAPYIYKGWAWEMNQFMGLTPENDPYNKQILTQAYSDYNKHVKEYFKHRPEDLLVLNVAKPNAYKDLCDFLNIETNKTDFPWENKTADIKK